MFRFVGVGVLTVETEREIDELGYGTDGGAEDGMVERDVFVDEARSCERFVFVFDEAVAANLNGAECGHEDGAA